MTAPTKHTPGPWTVSGDHILGCDGTSMMIVRRFGYTSDEQAGANARLVAAAPELLDALKQCLSALGSMYHDQFDGVWTDGDFDKELSPFRAAIAKAEGRE